MGIETLIAATAATSVIGGGMSLISSNKQANAMKQQGDTALLESIQDASLIQEQGTQFQASQKMKYIMSGVALSGSPLVALDDTAYKVQQQINAIKARGAAQRDLMYSNADTTKSEGRLKFLSGLSNTATSSFQLYTGAKREGMLSSQKGTASAANGVINTAT